MALKVYIKHLMLTVFVVLLKLLEFGSNTYTQTIKNRIGLKLSKAQ